MENNNGEDKRKHLEFIQNIITRMNSNSFMIKGWAVTLVSALLALFASTNQVSFLLITLLPIIIFWWLDTKYLQWERKFRSIYKKATSNPPSIDLYELNIEETTIKNDAKNQFWKTCKSESIWPFYLFLLLLTGLSIFILPKSEGRNTVPTNIHIQDTVKIKIIDTAGNDKKISNLNKPRSTVSAANEQNHK